MQVVNKIIESLASIPITLLERKFRGREVGSEKLQPPLIVRLDGVGFSARLKGFRQPRDPRVHSALVEAAANLVKWFNADYAHVASDEINVYLLAKREIHYSGRLFKIASIAAGIASSTVSLILGRQLFFDARPVILKDAIEAIDYYNYRSRVALGNLLTKICVAYQCENLHLLEKAKLLSSRNALKGLEEWMLTGTCLFWSKTRREAVDRKTGRRVVVERRVLSTSSNYYECLSRLREALTQLNTYTHNPLSSTY